jgi:molybdopterin-synthase adenylyltransferase
MKPLLPLDEATIRRYARQLLLREIGGAGQQKLLAARARARGAVAAEYLRRAGVTVEELPEPPASPVDRWLRGSLEAVAEIKRILGLASA